MLCMACIKLRVTPLGLFVQDLFKPSIRLKEDTPAIAPRTFLDEGALVSAQGTPLGR
jgi:hypothetical protein